MRRSRRRGWSRAQPSCSRCRRASCRRGSELLPARMGTSAARPIAFRNGGPRFALPTLRIARQNLLTTSHDRTGYSRRNRSPCPRLLARRLGRVPAAARLDRAAARLFLRLAAGAVGIDAAGVDARSRRRPRHHRAVCAGRHALHAEISVGAAGRRAACAVLHARLRPPPRLAGVFATAADRRDPAIGADRPGAFAAVRGARGAAGRDDVVDPGHRGRCVPRREPARERAGRRHGLLCRGLPDRHAGLDRRRAVPGDRIRIHRHRAHFGVDVGLCGDGRDGADRHGHGACRHRARAIRSRRASNPRRERILARADTRPSAPSRNS